MYAGERIVLLLHKQEKTKNLGTVWIVLGNQVPYNVLFSYI